MLEILRGVDVEVAARRVRRDRRGVGSGEEHPATSARALDGPTSGDIWLDGSRYADLDARGAAELRNRKLGLCFSFIICCASSQHWKTSMMPLLIAVRRRARHARAPKRCCRGRPGGTHDPPARRALGWRAATLCRRARARARSERGARGRALRNLDHANAERLHEIFFRLAREYETAVVVVTHNRQLAGRADRVLLLEDGRLTTVSSVDAIP